MKEFIAVVIVVVLTLAVALGVLWFQASQEAKSYRKFCDKPVTAYDAVWLDLRIDECN